MPSFTNLCNLFVQHLETFGSYCHVTMSSCHTVILPSCHSVIFSSCYPVTCHLNIMWFCHPLLLPSCQFVSWSSYRLVNLLSFHLMHLGACHTKGNQLRILWMFVKNLCRILNGYWRFLNANSKHWFWPDTHIELSSNLKIHFLWKNWISLYKPCLIFWLQIWFVSHFYLDWTPPDPQKMQHNQFFVFALFKCASISLVWFKTADYESECNIYTTLKADSQNILHIKNTPLTRTVKQAFQCLSFFVAQFLLCT